MKKIMLSSMILLPLILLLILSLNTAFVSLTTYVYVENVEILDAEETVYLKKTFENQEPEFKLETNIFPMLATNKEVVYSSDNEKIATVNNEGVIVGKGFGETFVKVEAAENKTKFSTRKVVVTADDVFDVKVNNIIDILYVGDKFKLDCDVIPEEANNKMLSYSSSNTDVAEISMTGEITAKAFGTTTITVKSISNSKVVKTFNLDVREHLENATIDGDTSKVLLEQATAKFPNIILYPTNAKADITYTSSDDNIATVDNLGNIKFNKDGIVDITVSIDGIYTFTKQYQYTNGYVYNAIIKGSSEFVYEDLLGKPCDLQIETQPLNIDKNNITVEISNEDVVYFNTDRKFYIKGGGVANIKITYKTSSNKTKSISKTINVTRKAEDIVFNNIDGVKSNVFYTSSKVFKVNATAMPIDSTYEVSLTTDTKDVVINDGNIVFPNVDYCKALVKATTNNGNLSKEFTVIYANDNNIKVVDIASGVNNVEMVMPKAIYNQEIDILFAVNKENINSIQVLENTKPIDIANILDKGNYKYNIKVNGVDFATVNLIVTREVERIENVTFTAVYDGLTEPVSTKNNMLYTSAKVVEVGYSLYPLNTTTTNAEINIVSGNAVVNGNKIEFNGIGNVEINLKADNVSKNYTIFSTFAHPDSDTTFIENIVLNKGDKLLYSNIVTNSSPSHIDNSFISYSTSSTNLTKGVDGFIANYGGNAVIDIKIDCAEGIINKQVNVLVNEEATDITLNKNYFVVENNYTILDSDYTILPATANYNINPTYTTTTVGATVDGNKVSYNGSGSVIVTITLENGVKKDICLLFKGDKQVLTLDNTTKELAVGTEFIASVPAEIGKEYNGITNLVGLEYNNGIFKVIKAVNSEDELYSASFTVADKTFSFKGVVYPEDINIDVADKSIFDATLNGYDTAKETFKVDANITNKDATYKGIIYQSSNESVATVDSFGNVTFIKAGIVNITATSNKCSNITKSITIHSTFGLADSIKIDLQSIELDFDSTTTNTIDLTNYINVYPTSASKLDNCKISIDSDIATVEGFKLTANKGGSGIVTISRKTDENGFVNVKSIQLNINRKATGILLNGNLLKGDTSITIDTGLALLETKYYPTDANVDTTIKTEIISGSENAVLSDGALLFLKKDVPVEIKVTLGNNICSYIITYKTTEIVAPVNIDNEVVVAPIENNVLFYSDLGNSFDVPAEFTKVSGIEGQYKASKSAVSTIMVNGKSKPLVITQNVGKIGNVTIEDYNNDSKQVEKIVLSDVVGHITASSKLKINVPILSAYNRNGELEKIELSTNDPSIATIINGELVFSKDGTVIVTATINGNDYYGKYTRKVSYNITSTMGMATDYTVNVPKNIVDTYNFSLANEITINKPQYGTNNIKFTLSSNDVFKVNGLDVTVLNTGNGKLIVESTNGINNNNEVFNIKVDQSVKDFIFKSGEYKILCDYTNSNTYKINTQLFGEKFVPTLTKLTYQVLSGSASVNGDGLVTFSTDYAVADIKVTTESAISKTIKIAKVPANVVILDIKDNSDLIVNNTTNYVFNIIGAEFSNFVETNSNIIIVNAETGTVKFVNGGSYNYSIKNQNKHFIVTQNVDKVTVSTNNVLTAKSEINLDELLNPTITPKTAYTKLGAVKIGYNLLSGNATIINNLLKFNDLSTAKIEVIADDKKEIVTIESTCGYVKSVEWNNPNKYDNPKDRLYYNNGGFAVLPSDFTVLPKDVDASKYLLQIEDNSVANITDYNVTFNKGGSTNLAIKYEVNNGNFGSVTTPLMVHHPVTTVDFLYDSNIVDKIIVNTHTYQLEYIINDDKASKYSVAFTSDANASVDNKGLVTFNISNTPSIINIIITNSDNTTLEKSIEVMTTDKKLIEISDKTIDNSLVTVEQNDSCLLYAVPINGSNPTYQVLEGNDVISVDSNGNITINKGGIAKVRVSANSASAISSSEVSAYSTATVDGYSKVIEIFVHKQTTNIDLTIADNIYSAQSTFDVTPTLTPADSNFYKDIEYVVSDNIVASIQNKKLVFNKAGKVDVTINVKYKGNIECSKTVHIQSSVGNVESFNIVDENNTLLENYVFSNSGISHTFTIQNILPIDAKLSTYDVSTTANSINITKNANSFIITSVDRGIGTVCVKVDNYQIQFAIETRLKVKSIGANLEGVEVNNNETYITMQDELKLKTSINPLNANDNVLNFVIDNGGKYDKSTGNLTLNNLGKYTIKISSNDGGATLEFCIEKIDLLNPFELTYKNKTATSNDVNKLTINPVFNEPTIELKFTNLPTNFVGSVNSNKISITTSADMKYVVKGNEIQLQIPVFTGANPTYKGNATISIGTQSIAIDIYRDGIKSIEFIDHDNNKDIEYGLQQVRLFGKKSYYGAVVPYYEVPVKIMPEVVGLKPILETSDSKVTAEYINGKIRVNFGTFIGNSVEDIKNDIFDKTVTVTAKDSSGEIKYSYTFHIINEGVNIFDQDGYVKNNQVVLHTNLGGTEEEKLSKYSPYTYTANSGKQLIYGNGFIVNFYAYNNTWSKDTNKYPNVNTSVGTAINVNLKGGNFDASKNTYHNNFGGGYFGYSKIQQTYKGTYAGNGQVVKKCYFRYIKDMSIQISDSDKQVFVEDIISIDGGNAALECQKNSFYLKGFIDVYNFKNEHALRDFTAGFPANTIINALKRMDKGLYINEVDRDVFFNVVIFCGKEIGSKRTVFFWNGTEYVEALEGNDLAAPGLVSLSTAAIPGGHVFTYPANGQFTVAHQNDFAYLARQEEKLWRTYDGRVIE